MSKVKDLSMLASACFLSYVSMISSGYVGRTVGLLVREKMYSQEVAYQCVSNDVETFPTSIPLPLRLTYFAGIEAADYNYIQTHKK
jgi:hypothetical protein